MKGSAEFQVTFMPVSEMLAGLHGSLPRTTMTPTSSVACTTLSMHGASLQGKFKVTPGVWHELRVQAVGKVSLWTEADSVADFDDPKVTAE
jgi:hypothetical protein